MSMPERGVDDTADTVDDQPNTDETTAADKVERSRTLQRGGKSLLPLIEPGYSSFKLISPTRGRDLPADHPARRPAARLGASLRAPRPPTNGGLRSTRRRRAAARGGSLATPDPGDVVVAQGRGPPDFGRPWAASAWTPSCRLPSHRSQSATSRDPLGIRSPAGGSIYGGQRLRDSNQLNETLRGTR
jgi:hypothetical protein